MRKFYKIMFKFWLIGMVALVVFAMIMGRSSGPDKTAASNFVIASSSGDLPQAYKALHQNLRKELSITEFSEGFKSTIPYVKVSFNSISVVNSKTTLTGSGETKNGCTSKLSFELLSNKITKYEFSPMCNK